MISVFKFCFLDLFRNRWAIIYSAFYLLVTTSLLLFSDNEDKVVVSLMNVVIFITPLVSMLIGVIYFYQNKEFIELILAQPIKRSHFFLGNYFGLVSSQIFSLLVGIGIPAIFIGNHISVNLFVLLLAAIILTLIFSALAILISVNNDNKLKGFGVSILWWLFFAIIYDGIFLLLLMLYSDYPLENFSLIAILLNPIDLARIMIILKLDYAALLGFTGASIRNFMGSELGFFVMLGVSLIWIVAPLNLLMYIGQKKDF